VSVFEITLEGLDLMVLARLKYVMDGCGGNYLDHLHNRWLMDVLLQIEFYPCIKLSDDQAFYRITYRLSKVRQIPL